SSLYNVYATRLQTSLELAKTGTPYKIPMMDDSVVSVGELRRHLQGKLPDYLVPAEIIFIDNLPRLPNGKVDRQALKSIDQLEPVSNKDFAAPISPVEEQLAQIWSDVLKQDAVGTSDNFFELGGDSILVMQIVSRIEGELDIRLLETAWQRVLEHQAILRTSFRWDGLDNPLQIVHRQVTLPFAQYDWRAFRPTEQESRLESFLLADRKTGFD